ncbi:hypothetical protein QJS10_CPB04g01154 [Acorus calamus]|uniref:DUF4283 domain-containing protein n=1 Tax=Acorus calamus TaxID=4465 RepID=A0AAV9EYS1_ACOCL|nr:hypothetical protein QJS10_CPB04g01154 [Acorus calamus]
MASAEDPALSPSTMNPSKPAPADGTPTPSSSPPPSNPKNPPSTSTSSLNTSTPRPPPPPMGGTIDSIFHAFNLKPTIPSTTSTNSPVTLPPSGPPHSSSPPSSKTRPSSPSLTAPPANPLTKPSGSEAFPALPTSGALAHGGPPPKKQRKAVPVLPPSSTQQIRSWGSLFQHAPTKSTVGSLCFIEPTVDGTATVASLRPESYAKQIQRWNQALVGYIIGKLPVYTPFLQFLKRLWNPKGEIQLLLHGNGFFTVKFDLEEDVNSVLEGGPWTMDHRPFILRKWSPDVRMEQERLSSIPIWIRLPNLPLHLWEADCLSRIGSILGVPLYADSATMRCSRASYARICVEIQATTSLPDSVLVDIAPGVRETFKVDYDWKPLACKFCQTFGHDEACCIMKPAIAKSVVGKGDRVACPAPLSKGKDKIISQWKEVQRPANTNKVKLLSDAMKTVPTTSKSGSKEDPTTSNQFTVLQESSPLEVSCGETNLPIGGHFSADGPTLPNECSKESVQDVVTLQTPSEPIPLEGLQQIILARNDNDTYKLATGYQHYEVQSVGDSLLSNAAPGGALSSSPAGKLVVDLTPAQNEETMDAAPINSLTNLLILLNLLL